MENQGKSEKMLIENLRLRIIKQQVKVRKSGQG